MAQPLAARTPDNNLVGVVPEGSGEPSQENWLGGLLRHIAISFRSVGNENDRSAPPKPDEESPTLRPGEPGSTELVVQRLPAATPERPAVPPLASRGAEPFQTVNHIVNLGSLRFMGDQQSSLRRGNPLGSEATSSRDSSEDYFAYGHEFVPRRSDPYVCRRCYRTRDQHTAAYAAASARRREEMAERRRERAEEVEAILEDESLEPALGRDATHAQRLLWYRQCVAPYRVCVNATTLVLMLLALSLMTVRLNANESPGAPEWQRYSWLVVFAPSFFEHAHTCLEIGREVGKLVQRPTYSRNGRRNRVLHALNRLLGSLAMLIFKVLLAFRLDGHSNLSAPWLVSPFAAIQAFRLLLYPLEVPVLMAPLPLSSCAPRRRPRFGRPGWPLLPLRYLTIVVITLRADGVLFGQWPWAAVLAPFWILFTVLAICAGVWGVQASASECH